MRVFFLILLLLSTITLAGCEMVGDIFQAGMAVGVILVVLVLVAIGYLGRKLMS